MNLVLKNVYKNYENIEVLKDISLEISHISTLGIIGESGCGKSTLLRQLAGIEDINSGFIQINSLNPSKDKKEFQSKVSYVFQKHNLFPHLTVEDNIFLILSKIKNMQKDEAKQRVQEVLQMLHIQKEAQKYPHQISGGQAQRASIARAIATKPELVFLDEPTAALDPILSNEVLSSIKELKQSGVEFIFVTHEMGFLKEFCDYFVFLKDGKICEQGSAILLKNPQTQELKRFLEAR